MRWWEATASCSSQRAHEAEGSLNPLERRVWVDSSPDNDGTDQHRQMVRVRQARQEGVREEPASESSSRDPAARTWRGSGPRSNAPHIHDDVCGELLGRLMSPTREATVNACGVAVAMLQGHSWAPTPAERLETERGNYPADSLTGQHLVGRREGLLPADAGGMGRRTRS